jgi:hypothetical protein
MRRAVHADASARRALGSCGLGSLLLAGVVSACWWPVTHYPPGAIIRPMLPVMATAAVLALSGRLVAEALTLRRVGWAGRLGIALLPLAAATVALAWPIAIRAVLGLDMSG